MQTEEEKAAGAATPTGRPAPTGDFKKWKYAVAGAAVLLVLAAVLGVGYTVYAVKNLSQSGYVLKVAEVLNLPAVRVNGVGIPYYLYVEDINTLKEFYKRAPTGLAPEFSEAELSEQVLSRLIVNAIIKDIAREFKVSVNEDDINEVKQTILVDYDSLEEVELMLATQYGWTMDEYIGKIVKPFVLEKKTGEFFALNEGRPEWEVYQKSPQIRARHILFKVENKAEDSRALVEAKKVLERIKAGEDFASLAAEFSSDATGSQGGDLGWFGRGVMVAEFEAAAFALGPGEVVKEPVKTEFGYHIVKVEEKREIRSFQDLLNDRLYEANVEILINVADPLVGFRAAVEEARSLQELNALELE